MKNKYKIFGAILLTGITIITSMQQVEVSNAASKTVNAKFKTYKDGTPNTGWPYEDSIFTKYQYDGILSKKEKLVYKELDSVPTISNKATINNKLTEKQKRKWFTTDSRPTSMEYVTYVKYKIPATGKYSITFSDLKAEDQNCTYSVVPKMLIARVEKWVDAWSEKKFIGLADIDDGSFKYDKNNILPLKGYYSQSDSSYFIPLYEKNYMAAYEKWKSETVPAFYSQYFSWEYLNAHPNILHNTCVDYIRKPDLFLPLSVIDETNPTKVTYKTTRNLKKGDYLIIQLSKLRKMDPDKVISDACDLKFEQHYTWSYDAYTVNVNIKKIK